MQFKQMFVTPICVLFLLQLKWPKTKNFYEFGTALYPTHVHSCRLTFHDLWRNHCKQVYYFPRRKPVFQPKCKFLFACLLRSLRSNWEDVKCKWNVSWVLVFESIVELKKLAFRISLPLPALLELPALSSPASRTPPDPYSPMLPLPYPPQ